YPENTVIEELQKGYTLHGRVIRPSLVKVSN
ncbi:MAG: nucleotide exchange factor GrpE, partial [Syntrophomonadaceae bacterium]|nr:nucleotide exchange factor GrpE [Syntrophomonadaceae bacterium]